MWTLVIITAGFAGVQDQPPRTAFQQIPVYNEEACVTLRDQINIDTEVWRGGYWKQWKMTAICVKSK